MLPLAETGIEILANPEHAAAKAWLASAWALPVVCAATLVMGTVFAVMVAKLWRKPRAAVFARADFGTSELDLALLVPLAVVFMVMSGLVAGAVRTAMEPQAMADAFRAAQQAGLGPAELAEALAFARSNLSPAELGESTLADHAGKLAGALVLCLYVPMFLYVVRGRKAGARQPANEQHAIREALHFSAAKRDLWKTLPLFLAWVPLAFCLLWLSVAILAVIRPETTEASHAFTTQPVLARLMAPSFLQWPAAIVSAVIAAPLFEEFAFRAAIQGSLRRFMPFPLALLIAVVLFTAVHEWQESPQIIAPVAGLGIALGWVYERTGNIWHAVALHAMHNAATLALASMSVTV